MMSHPGWSLVVLGAVILGIGLIWVVSPSIPWLGRLPGDVAIQRDNFQFYFPITTCIVLSVVFSAIMWLVRYFSKSE